LKHREFHTRWGIGVNLRGQLSGLRERRDGLFAAKPSNVAVYSTLCLTLPGDNQYTTVDFTVHSGNRREKAPK